MNTINKISLVAAIGKNGEIGVDGSLPWVSSKELSVFKKITNGGIVIMGRKTFDSIGSKLNGRFNVVISESKDTQDQITKLKDPSIDPLELVHTCFILCAALPVGAHRAIVCP